MEPDPPPDRWRREELAVAVITLIGAGIRAWPPGRLGLTHFDEGIYALAASWSLAPGGLTSIDPSLIPYSPPGYPILAGMAYAILGRSDSAAIAASQISGTVTIPVVAWFARRTFGPGAGAAGAALAAFSGSHVAFSRMALTDASALLMWLVALGLGVRFLERPGAVRALAMGAGVGLAQQFKYNGWLAGAIVAGTAALGPMIRAEERRAASLLGTFGWGGAGVGAAWLVVWPWYRFVEAHGGYSDLLRHQKGYLGGFRDWWPHFWIQSDQAVALSGGARLILVGLGLGCLACWFSRAPTPMETSAGRHPISRRLALMLGFGFLPWGLADAPYWLGLIAGPALLFWPAVRVRLLAVWWFALAVLSPFYHPYARLWLPYHAVNWILMAGLISLGSTSEGVDRIRARFGIFGRSMRLALPVGLVLLFALGAYLHRVKEGRGARRQPDLLTPSDSLRRAVVHLASILPEEVAGLRVLARPPVTYYLAGRFPLAPMSGSDQLRSAGDPRAWAVVDSAILRSESGKPGGPPRDLLAPFLDRWEVVEEFPTTLALPTLLDLDPGAARSRNASRSSPLWLLRPRSPEAPR